MSTSYSYVAEVYEVASRTSGHFPSGLTDHLNRRAAEGWRLVSMAPIAVGYLLVLERSA